MIYGRVYGLYDPETDELRYVGQTTATLAKRLSSHLSAQNRATHRHSSRWIKGLMDRGLRPIIRELATAGTRDELDALEKFHIERSKSMGARLANHTDGGVGPTGWKHTDEWKQQMSELRTGRNVNTPEHYQRLADSKRGIPRTPEVKAKISASKVGTPSPKRGIPMSEEQKAKVSASRTGKLLGSSHHQFRDDVSTDYILQRLNAGLSKVQVAEELGVSGTFIHRRLKQAKTAGQNVPPRGKQVPMDQVRELRAQGATLRDLASRFTISQAYMCRALKEVS